MPTSPPSGQSHPVVLSSYSLLFVEQEVSPPSPEVSAHMVHHISEASDLSSRGDVLLNGTVHICPHPPVHVDHNPILMHG